MDTVFQRLLRFIDQDGNTRYGEAGSITDPAELVGACIQIFEGSEPWDSGFRASSTHKVVKEVK
ncbi:uncharacterized protein A1O5_06641 [Cladophialophora psammophila CBS 110553]|uniref:Uncharacterized protein n=1 Tax=Cladophialophora psammophila CBS 110553 TaxID=1182543 RepID=W9X0W7_9EURO|nr:uncharacterized protein A1O5_06641 [Cladophialophora psammophila CBS 110553]EXJ70571.1 hypothetical protein A1O5_06641 [Cladophialophora psammophila CBS 110553]